MGLGKCFLYDYYSVPRLPAAVQEMNPRSGIHRPREQRKSSLLLSVNKYPKVFNIVFTFQRNEIVSIEVKGF